MKNELYNFSLRPSVLLTGAKTKLTVIPLDEIYFFDSETDYRIEVFPTAGRNRENIADFSRVMRPVNGRLFFDVLLNSEQEYYVFITRVRGDKRIARLSLYALDKDLYSLRPLKGDFHVHTTCSDGSQSPEIVAANYRRAGFDFMGVTDHGNYGGSVQMINAYKGVSLGMTLAYGEEVHSPDNYVHILNFGGGYSVNQIFYDDEKKYYSEIEEIIANEDIPGEDKFIYAAGVWVSRKIAESGGLSVFCHPYWITGIYNVPEWLTREFIKNRVFDCLELIGGQSARENNMQTAMYYQLRSDGYDTPVIGVSDSHGTQNAPLFKKLYSVVFAKSNTVDDIISAVKAGKSTAIEEYEDSVNYSVHGTFRYVSYAAFLIENYFPLTAELCFEEGRLMREYILGDESAAESLEKRKNATDNFYREYFGIK